MSDGVHKTKLGYADIDPLWKGMTVAALVVAILAFFLVCIVITKISVDKEKERNRQIDERIRHLENQTTNLSIKYDWVRSIKNPPYLGARAQFCDYHSTPFRGGISREGGGV